MRNSANSPLLHVDFLKTPSSIMNENTLKKMPVVKLKIGEIMPNIKRSHTIAEMNNLRSNYSNYSHYRVVSAGRHLPSASSNNHGSSHADKTIFFVLRGMSGSKKSKPLQSPTPGPSPSPVSSNPSRSPLFKRTFRLTKSHERFSDLNSPSLQEMNGYGVIGNSLTQGTKTKESETSINEPKNSVVKKSSASLKSRPNSYLTSRQHTAIQARDYSAFDRGEGYLDQALVTKTPKTARKVYFDETKRITNIRYLQDRSSVRTTRNSADVAKAPEPQPLQLTIKNLEMFDYFSVTQKDKDSEQMRHKVNSPNPRVLSWVQNTPHISGILEEPEFVVDLSKDKSNDLTEANEPYKEYKQTDTLVLNNHIAENSSN